MRRTPHSNLSPDVSLRPPAPAPYLLLASLSTHPSLGRPRQLLAAFPTESEARQAFQVLRLKTRPRTEWAQLVEVDATGRLRPVCWFGPGPQLVDGTESPWWGNSGNAGIAEITDVKPVVRRRRTWPRKKGNESALPADSFSVYG
jgi:hypothetical protein